MGTAKVRRMARVLETSISSQTIEKLIKK